MDNYRYLIQEIQNSGTNFIRSIEKVDNVVKKNINSLLICGMGGSGISGDYIKFLNRNEKITIFVNKDYELPKIENHFFIIVISYSGNTEETLSMTNQLIAEKKEFIIISSGGELKKLSHKLSIPFYEVPNGLQPRAALPYILGTLYGLTKKLLNLPTLDGIIKNQIINASNDLGNVKLKQKLNNIALNILPSLPIILSPNLLEGVGLRFRCQINENAKIQAFNFLVPEFNHNGIVGIDGLHGKKQIFILIQSKFQNKRTSLHFKFLLNHIKDKIANVIVISSEKQSFVEEILDITWQLDYISVLLAQLQKINPIEVPSIDLLKKELSIHK